MGGRELALVEALSSSRFGRPLFTSTHASQNHSP